MAMTYSTLAEVQTAEVSSTAVQEIQNQLAQLHETFASTTDRMQRVLDRAFGSQGEASKASSPRPIQPGEIGTIRDRLDDLGSIASQQRALLARLDTLV